MLLAVVGSDAYKWLLAFHILVAVVWVGSNVAIQIFVIRARRAGPRPPRLPRERDRVVRNPRPASPSLTVVILGFILLHESSGAYDLGQGWVTFGFIVWLLSSSRAPAILGLSQAGSARGRGAGARGRRVSAPARRIFLVSRIELVLLILVVLDMAVKPGLS